MSSLRILRTPTKSRTLWIQRIISTLKILRTLRTPRTTSLPSPYTYFIRRRIRMTVHQSPYAFWQCLHHSTIIKCKITFLWYKNILGKDESYLFTEWGSRMFTRDWPRCLCHALLCPNNLIHLRLILHGCLSSRKFLCRSNYNELLEGHNQFPCSVPVTSSSCGHTGKK